MEIMPSQHLQKQYSVGFIVAVKIVGLRVALVRLLWGVKDGLQTYFCTCHVCIAPEHHHFTIKYRWAWGERANRTTPRLERDKRKNSFCFVADFLFPLFAGSVPYWISIVVSLGDSSSSWKVRFSRLFEKLLWCFSNTLDNVEIYKINTKSIVF